MEKLFKLKAAGTNVRTEFIAGITTFFTMAYIIFVNPSILSASGMDETSVMVATCLSAALGTFLIGWLSNYPFAQAPGMGVNAFFAYTICGTMGFSWQAALAAVFCSGIIFILITVSGVREAIVNSIPMSLKRAISAGIGLFIALIGLDNAGIIEAGVGTAITMGDISNPVAVLAIIGLIITSVLVVRKVKGGLFIGIIATTAVGCIMQFVFGLNVNIFLPQSLAINLKLDTFGQFIYGFSELFAFKDGLAVGFMSLITVLLSLTMVDMFDTIGTLIGTAEKAGFLDKDGKLPRAGNALLADAIATVTGAVLGTSTVTTYVESTAGVSEGGRTGLTSMVTAALFIISLFLAPIIGIVPAAATAPILVIVGVLMVASLRSIEWDKVEEALPAFMTAVMMPFTYSIADGIGMGFIFYTIVKIATGKAKEVHGIMYGIVVLFLLRYIFMAIG